MSDQEPMDCAKCHRPHGRCTGHNRAGGPCGKHPKKGQRVCGNHGGDSPQALAAAERRIAEAEAVEVVNSMSLRIDIAPHDALLDELGRSHGVVTFLDSMVSSIKTEDLVYGQVRQKTGGEDHGTTYEARPNVWYDMWFRERGHYLAVATACTRAGIDERRQRLAEEDGMKIAGVLGRIFTKLYEALVGALGEHAAARVVVESLWPQLIGEIVPGELRAVAEGMSEAVPA